jgi:hypothetical protein
VSARWSRARRALRAWRLLAWIGLSGLGYLGLRLGFARLGEADGLLTPSGVPHLGLGLLGLGVLGLRLLLLFVAPALLVYHLLEPLLARAICRPSPGEAPRSTPEPPSA